MIFPTLQGKRFGLVNLNSLATVWFSKHSIAPTDSNPLLNPDTCGEMVTQATIEAQADFSYGGWMEDREALWRGTYLDETKSYIHLGIDFNVPYQTPIAMPSNCKVVRVDSDVPEEGGWGTRVIVKVDNEPIFLIFAHLDPAVLVTVGDLVVTGTQFAFVGRAPLNGGWFPHLHVQAVQENYFELLMNDDLRTLDGYGHKKDLETLMKAFPDPMHYLSRIP